MRSHPFPGLRRTDSGHSSVERLNHWASAIQDERKVVSPKAGDAPAVISMTWWVQVSFPSSQACIHGKRKNKILKKNQSKFKRGKGKDPRRIGDRKIERMKSKKE